MDISTNTIEHFGIVAGIFDELGIDKPTFRINSLNAHQFICYRFFKESIYFNAVVCVFRPQIRFTST